MRHGFFRLYWGGEILYGTLYGDTGLLVLRCFSGAVHPTVPLPARSVVSYLKLHPSTAGGWWSPYILLLCLWLSFRVLLLQRLRVTGYGLRLNAWTVCSRILRRSDRRQVIPPKIEEPNPLMT